MRIRRVSTEPSAAVVVRLYSVDQEYKCHNSNNTIATSKGHSQTS